MAASHSVNLTIVSFNMHGFSQGFSTVRDLCLVHKPAVFLLQEHWLIPSNLGKFDQLFPDYFMFGSSAMTGCTENNLLRGRPFGGVMTMIRNDLQLCTRTLYSSDRCVIVKVADYLLINAYLPCVGTVDRLLTIEDVLSDISNCITDNSDCTILIGGDLNCDLDGVSEAAKVINDFASDNQLHRCDSLKNCHTNTYVNIALNCGSCVDYFLVSNCSRVISFDVIDEGSNLSDHLPIIVECRSIITPKAVGESRPRNDKYQTFLRWDHADIGNYYAMTGQRLQLLLTEFTAFESDCLKYSTDVRRTESIAFIEYVYNCIVSTLVECAKINVPVRTKQFYKFWWDQELDSLKEDSISSHKLWKAAGKPRFGPLFSKFRACKLLYKKRIREHQRSEVSSYTCDLHEALLDKKGTNFWKCWKSKFGSNSKRAGQVDGLTDEKEIVSKFEDYFTKVCSNLTPEGSKRLDEVYNNMRPGYCGLPFDEELRFDVELVDKAVRSLGCGKAAGLDSLTADHLHHSHPALYCLLNKLFNLMIKCGYVPHGFGLSYTVPLPKSNYASVSKSLTVDDFRGISISPVISKVFEKCILDRYYRFFETSDSQFGFKKGIGCSHSIYSVRCVVDHFVRQGSTVNLCALDLRKAFDKMNHHGLFVKLMERMLPNSLLSTLEHWFSVCSTCVRWGDTMSNFIKLTCGVRQGGVLSAYLFAVYIDDLIKTIKRSKIGCMFGILAVNIFVYADDIVLLAPSVGALQRLLTLCEDQLSYLDMALNAKKSVCIRFGSRFKDECFPLCTTAGETLCWVDNCRYLGVFLTAAKKFKSTISNNKRSFYRSFNDIFSKVGRYASEELMVKLISAKCLPVFVYGLDACPVSLTDKRTLDFVMTRALMRVFRTGSVDIINQCCLMFHFRKASAVVVDRKCSFLRRFADTDNSLCIFFAETAQKERLGLLTNTG